MSTALQHWTAEANLPALSLAVVEQGKIVYNYSTGPSVGEDTSFQVCCLGKAPTMMAMLLLQEEGRLNLDDPAARYLPCSSLPKPAAMAATVTIRQLLAHRAGIIRGSFRPYPRDADEYACEAQESAFAYPPGSNYKFSNLGYFLVGAILERVTNTTVPEFLMERIFRPLEMASATFTRPLAAPGGLSRGEYYALAHGDDRLEPATLFPLPAAAGGFYCTSADYARFLSATMDGDSAACRLSDRIRAEFRRMTTDGEAMLRQTGSNSGYSGLALANYSRRTCAVALCNRANASHELQRALEIAGGHIWSRDAAPSGCFAGEYASDSDLLRLRPNGTGLLAELGPTRFGLRRRSANSFVSDEGPLREYLLRFALRDGRARSCSAGPHYFSDDSAPVRHSGPPPDIAGSYRCPSYATAEVFVRRNGLYCLCGPLHETRLLRLGSDLYKQQGGLFDGEILRFRRCPAGRIRSLEMGGMAFARLEGI